MVKRSTSELFISPIMQIKMNLKLNPLLLFITFLISSSHCFAQSLPFNPEVKRGRLMNGMMYYLQKNAKPEKRAELRLVVNAGSLLEDNDQLGLAHFVEHMAFNGTENFAKNDLVDFLELTGTRFGADLNAYTSFDETVYQLQVRTDSMELFDKGLLILQDWASTITFDPEEIDKERGVVISEWRTRLSPDQRLQQQYFPILYQDSRYAERLPIGDPEIIEKATPATIKRFYQDWYRPDLMAIVAVGDFDLGELESKILSQFSKLENPDSPRKRTKYKLPLHDVQRNVVATDPEAPFTQIRLQIKMEESPVQDQNGMKEQLSQVLLIIEQPFICECVYFSVKLITKPE